MAHRRDPQRRPLLRQWSDGRPRPSSNCSTFLGRSHFRQVLRKQSLPDKVSLHDKFLTKFSTFSLSQISKSWHLQTSSQERTPIAADEDTHRTYAMPAARRL